MQTHTPHDPETVTQQHGKKQGQPAAENEEVRSAAIQSAVDTPGTPSGAIDLRPERALVVWYRLGLTVPNLRPPKGFAYAYHLGRRMVALRSREK